ncbi:MAG: ABC transporter ATP-binding protein [Firmicutes bacterium]|nr:ABC transporter ATP-binding protein [Bacillota bacterium]
MLKLLRNLKPRDVGFMLIAITFIITQVWLDLAMPGYMSEITLLVQTPGSAMADINHAAVMMLLCAFGSLIASVITAVCAAQVAASFSSTLRHRLFAKVQSFSMGEIGRFSTASLITRTTNDVMQVQMLIVMGLQALVKAPITACWAIGKIIDKSWQWTASVSIAVMVLLLIITVCRMLAMPKFKLLQQLTDRLNRVTRENLTGLRVVRAYNAEDYQEAKFAAANAELTATQLFAQRVMAFMRPGTQMVNNGLALAIYWLGAALIHNAAPADKLVLFSDMVVFSQYGMQVVMSFMMVSMIFVMLPRAAVSAARINEVLETEPAIGDGGRDAGEPGRQGEIEFRHVSFAYPDAEEAVLEDISFTARRGETVAIIGATGSGKSTLINLIPRFYDATAGEVLVDGVNVRDYEQQSLRRKIGYISQKAQLFSGSVADNISYGENGEADAARLQQALATAQAADFVAELEGGAEGHVAQGGNNLSGGQKQRLSIARALYRKPEILIFDDSFSALDYKTDRLLRDELDKTCAGTTRIIVAQRIGTIRDADRILVLDEGRIVGQGRHEELLQSCEVYRQIALSQLSKEELGHE